MVLWQKPSTIPSFLKIDHRRGLLSSMKQARKLQDAQAEIWQYENMTIGQYDNCFKLPKVDEGCHKMPKFGKNCERLPKVAKVGQHWQKLTKVSKGWQKWPKDAKRCNLVNSGQYLGQQKSKLYIWLCLFCLFALKNSWSLFSGNKISANCYDFNRVHFWVSQCNIYPLVTSAQL